MSTKTLHNILPDVVDQNLKAPIDAELSQHFNLDRYLGDSLILPYSFSDIKIKSNELCVSDKFNASIYKLYYNFLYKNVLIIN